MSERQHDDEVALPWRKFAGSPIFFVPAAVLVYGTAWAFVGAVIFDVFRVMPVELGGVGFTWLTVLGAASFGAITGVNVANRMAAKKDDDK